MAIIPGDEKVFMVDKRTNTIYGGSAALQAMQQWYTMQDVSDSIQPYKVFTALLTQKGGDFLDQLDYTSVIQNVTKGVTYNIGATDIGADFTNVGAPNNNEGTSFIAINNEIPNSWGESEGSALIFNTGAPVATVLENTIGNVWFTYVANGTYLINSNGLFTIDKCWCTRVIELGVSGPSNRGVLYDYENGNQFAITTELDIDSPSNDLLNNTPIEIRVYN